MRGVTGVPIPARQTGARLGWQAVAVRDAVGGGGCDPASGGKPHRSDAVLSSQADDLLLDHGGVQGRQPASVPVSEPDTSTSTANSPE